MSQQYPDDKEERWLLNLRQKYIELFQTFGGPDLFITFTCNPHWKEIKNNQMGIPYWNKPDVVIEVFQSKLQEFINEVVEKQIFGQKIKCYVYTIEFQKRGLPHAHCLLTLEKRITTPDEVNEIVSAEIPDKKSNEELFNIVMDKMISFKFRNKTYMKSIYPLYKRRDNSNEGHQKFINGKENNVNNTMVTPYNPALLKMFNCHLNVEVCINENENRVFYTTKYITKDLNNNNYGTNHYKREWLSKKYLMFKCYPA